MIAFCYFLNTVTGEGTSDKWASVCYHKCESLPYDVWLSTEVPLLEAIEGGLSSGFPLSIRVNQKEGKMAQDSTPVHVSTTATYSHPGHSPGTSAIHMRISHSPVEFKTRAGLKPGRLESSILSVHLKSTGRLSFLLKPLYFKHGLSFETTNDCSKLLIRVTSEHRICKSEGNVL